MQIKENVFFLRYTHALSNLRRFYKLGFNYSCNFHGKYNDLYVTFIPYTKIERERKQETQTDRQTDPKSMCDSDIQTILF